MSVPYPKQPKDILIRITNRDVIDGLRSAMPTMDEMPLSEKLDEYLVRLGYSSTHIMGIAVRLLTKTKVRVDFRNYTERMELMDVADMLTTAQAISLLEDYMTSAHPPEQKPGSGMEATTQRIVVQIPQFEKPGNK